MGERTIWLLGRGFAPLHGRSAKRSVRLFAQDPCFGWPVDNLTWQRVRNGSHSLVDPLQRASRDATAASERSERATRTERAGAAARERACRGVRGAKPLGRQRATRT